MTNLRQPIPAFPLAWTLFAAAACAPTLWEDLPVWADHAITKTLLAAFSFVGILVAGGPWCDWGLRRPADPRWTRCVLRGGSLGATATTAIMLSPAEGMTWIAELGVPGIILWIWLYSSITEELFVRGWFQRFVQSRHRVALSAALFGSMHLTILRNGADLWTVGIIVIATTTLGLLAAQDRERTGSLGLPIVTHIAFNIGGFVAAIVVTLAVFIATGERPTP